MQFSWVVWAGWSVTSNESRVTSNQCPPPKNGNNLSNSSHRSYECPPPPVGAGGGGRKTVGGWGLSPEALAKGDTSNSLVIAKERETLKTLAYDCGNPGIICLRAFARSAFLFTGSPRSFHSLAMTKGTKWIIPHSLTTPSASRHPSTGGELSPRQERTTFPSAEGWHEVPGWSVTRN